MKTFSTSHDFALQLDQQDKLAPFKGAFVIPDPSLVYFDGNSLGMMPKAAQQKSRQVVDEQWGQDLIRGWNKGWWDAPSRVGDKIGGLIGAAAGQTLVGDTVSINLFKLATSALTLQPNRKRIITDTFNFPSDLYILQGIKQTSRRSTRNRFDRLTRRRPHSRPRRARSSHRRKHCPRHTLACRFQKRIHVRHAAHHRTCP